MMECLLLVITQAVETIWNRRVLYMVVESFVMARVVKYKEGKKYIQDLNIGRSWRVLEKRERRGRMKK